MELRLKFRFACNAFLLVIDDDTGCKVTLAMMELRDYCKYGIDINKDKQLKGKGDGL